MLVGGDLCLLACFPGLGEGAALSLQSESGGSQVINSVVAEFRWRKSWIIFWRRH